MIINVMTNRLPGKLCSYPVSRLLGCRSEFFLKLSMINPFVPMRGNNSLREAYPYALCPDPIVPSVRKMDRLTALTAELSPTQAVTTVNPIIDPFLDFCRSTQG